jgi:hypothetical protein
MKPNILLEVPPTGLCLQLVGMDWQQVLEQPFYEAEVQVQEVVKQVGQALTKAVLESHIVNVDQMVAQGSIWTRKAEPSAGHYQSLYGEITVQRPLYQRSQGGPTLCPLEVACQLRFGSATPLLAEVLAFKVSSQTPREVSADLQKGHRLSLSAHYIRDVAYGIGEKAWRQREALKVEMPLAVEEQVEVIATGMDGTTVPIVGEHFKEAMAGTLAVYGSEGQRLATQYLGTMPEEGKLTFQQHLLNQTQQMQQRFPQAGHVCLGDGARSNWEFFETHFPNSEHILDFYHASEHLKAVLDVLGEGQPPEERNSFYEECRTLLKEQKNGVDLLLSFFEECQAFCWEAGAAKVLETHIGYFHNNAHRMRYWEYQQRGYPIGSGVTEAACKELIKARFSRSGMRWYRETGQKVLHLRAIKLSQQWEGFWKQIMLEAA